MASEIWDYLLAWARMRASMYTNHETGAKTLGSVLGVLAGQNVKIIADVNRTISGFGDGEHG